MSRWIRQVHRWVSAGFAVVVAAIFAAQGMGATVAEWVYLLPLAPLLVQRTRQGARRPSKFFASTLARGRGHKGPPPQLSHLRAKVYAKGIGTTGRHPVCLG